jgi:hypothetical protein
MRTAPKDGGGAETAWRRIPAQYRNFVRDNNIRVYILPGFEIDRVVEIKCLIRCPRGSGSG